MMESCTDPLAGECGWQFSSQHYSTLEYLASLIGFIVEAVTGGITWNFASGQYVWTVGKFHKTITTTGFFLCPGSG